MDSDAKHMLKRAAVAFFRQLWIAALVLIGSAWRWSQPFRWSALLSAYCLLVGVAALEYGFWTVGIGSTIFIGTLWKLLQRGAKRFIGEEIEI